VYGPLLSDDPQQPYPAGVATGQVTPGQVQYEPPCSHALAKEDCHVPKLSATAKLTKSRHVYASSPAPQYCRIALLMGGRGGGGGGGGGLGGGGLGEGGREQSLPPQPARHTQLHAPPMY
jgi:hypothetical protein